MNSKQAKALRRELKFNVHGRREYIVTNLRKKVKFVKGKTKEDRAAFPKGIPVAYETCTLVCAGERRAYQDAKKEVA